MELDLADGELRGYWKDHAPDTEPGKPRAIQSMRKVSQTDPGWDLLPGESRGYWKYHAPGKWFKQAKAAGKINNTKVTLLLDSGAEVSIVSTTIARKVGCIIDESQRQECVGIGESVYTTMGRTTIKITLAGFFVYCFDAWVGELAGQDAILGMDFMIPAGIRFDLADGTMCLPDEVRIQLAGRRPLYGRSSHDVTLDEGVQIEAGESMEVPIRRPRVLEREKLWVARGERWVPTVTTGLGRTQYMTITNISDEKLALPRLTRLGLWLAKDLVPRLPGLISVGSRRYAEWQNLAFEATVDQPEEKESGPEYDGPLVDRPRYDPPKGILKRGEPGPRPVVVVAAVREADPVVSDPTAQEPKLQPEQERPTTQPIDVKEDPAEVPASDDQSVKVEPKPDESGEDDEVCFHEGRDLIVEDLENQMAILPDVGATTEEVTIEDIQIEAPEGSASEDIDRLRRIIWRRRHLLIGKGNALPPAARGAVCDIDVGDATPIAQRVRRVAPQFRDKVSDLLKGLLSAKIIAHSTSPWASPIVVIFSGRSST
jgi:hypothetical protein